MRNKRILFVNPNRYRHPPVIPLGIEYLLHALRENSFEVDVIDLCFSDRPILDIEDRMKSFLPDAVCMTIRNLDSALYLSNEYFLPEIRRYISYIKSLTDAPVVVGGAAVTADPEGILRYVGADSAVVGPGEETLPLLLRESDRLKEGGKVVRGRFPKSFCPARASTVAYGPYIEKKGIPGFETHKGCTASCSYCIEADTPVGFREPSDVICELRGLVEGGFEHFHLCDSEFNEDLDFSIDILDAIVRERFNMKWTLYMRPGNYNKRLFRLLRNSGAYLITLTADTFHKCPEYWSDVETMVFLAKKNGIRIAIDLLTGFPYEDENTLRETLDFFQRIEPDEVVVNSFIRIYANTRIRQVIDNDPSLKKFVLGSTGSGDGYLAPLFYSHIPLERLGELIKGNRLFRIAGEEKGVNYERAL